MRIRPQQIRSRGLAQKLCNREDAMCVPDYRPEYIFSYTVQVRPPLEVVGPTRKVSGANFYIAGGEVDGPKLKGKFVPGGGDWLLVRRDGVAILDVGRRSRRTTVP
jgi:hypothetical protein